MYHSIIEHHADGPTSVFVAGKLGSGQIGIGQLGFAWNWINVFGLTIVVLLLIPNIFYAVKHRGEENLCENRMMNVLEQVGRYGSMIFMCIYFGGSEFGFSSVAEFLCFIMGNAVLLLTYWILWGIYAALVWKAGEVNEKTIRRVRLSLAAVPSLLFVLSAITLKYIPLLVCAILFSVGHIYVTLDNMEKKSIIQQ